MGGVTRIQGPLHVPVAAGVKSKTVVSYAASTVFPTSENGGIESKIKHDLDYEAAISKWETAGLHLASFCFCAIALKLTKLSRVTPVVGLGLFLLWTGCFGLARLLLLEAKYQAIRRPEAELSDRESKFANVEQVCLHFKSTRSTKPTLVGVHLYHGFGSNLYSWRKVQQPLSEQLEACVTSHDTPGFGLTSRPNQVQSYTLEFNGRLGRSLCNQEVENNIKDQLSSNDPCSLGKKGSNLETKTILVGHSMGTVSAIHEVVNNPSGITALVLVAPAIRPPKRGADKVQGHASPPTGLTVFRFISIVTKVLLESAALVCAKVGLWFSQPFFALSLRWALRRKDFWSKNLRRAYFYESSLGEFGLNSYRLPQLVRGWEQGIVFFVRAGLLGGTKSIWARFADAFKQIETPSLIERLSCVVEKNNIQVLIVHGENDLLIPLSNSKILARYLPNSKLLILPECGHVPHEEYPERFVQSVVEWQDL